MNWLKKNWIIPVLLIILIAGYFVWKRVFKNQSVTAGANDNAGIANLNSNANKYQNWGVTISRPTTTTYKVEGQGNGNYFTHTWTRDEILQMRSEMIANGENTPGTGYHDRILVNETSTDNDFAILVFLAFDGFESNEAVVQGMTSGALPYIYAGVYDLAIGPPNLPGEPMSPSVKAAVRMDRIPYAPIITVLKSPPASASRPRLRG